MLKKSPSTAITKSSSMKASNEIRHHEVPGSSFSLQRRVIESAAAKNADWFWNLESKNASALICFPLANYAAC